MGKLELEFPKIVPKLKEEFDLRLREEIVKALVACNGNVLHTAQALGTKRTTLLMYIRKFELQVHTKRYQRRVAQR